MKTPSAVASIYWRFLAIADIFFPSCHAKRVAAFADWMAAEVLADVPPRQVVFTIPKMLRQHFRLDRKLLGLLSSCAYDAVREMMQAVADNPRAFPGLVISLQIPSISSPPRLVDHVNQIHNNRLRKPLGFSPR